MRVAVKCAYNGVPFHGFARQPNLKTVEGLIVAVLEDKGYITNPKESMFRSSSRTDKGVSALGNVVAFNTEKSIDNLFDECNSSFKNIVFYGKKFVDTSFYPRHAKQRIYSYYLPKDKASLETVRSIIPLFIGTHDFTNFARVESNKNPVRTIVNIHVTEIDEFFVLTFHAPTYLWHQIRRIISAIIQVEQQKIKKKSIQYAVEHPDKKVDFGLAPPHRLVLEDVIYDFSFSVKPEALEKKKEIEETIFHMIKYPSLKIADKIRQKMQ